MYLFICYLLKVKVFILNSFLKKNFKKKACEPIRTGLRGPVPRGGSTWTQKPKTAARTGPRLQDPQVGSCVVA